MLKYLGRRDQRGLSFVELLVGMLVLSLVAAGAAAGYRALARVAPAAGKAAEGAEALTTLQRVGEELQNAVTVTEATPTSVTVVASTSSSAVAWRYTDPATGGQGVLRRYTVRYYFRDGTLYRAVGAPPSWRPIPNPVGALPIAPEPGQPPTAPTVPHPGQAPDCPEPCYDPAGAYWARWKVTWNGGMYGHCSASCISWDSGQAYIPIVDGNSATPLARDHYTSPQVVAYFHEWCGGYDTGCDSRLTTSALRDWPYRVLTGSTGNSSLANKVTVPGRYGYCYWFGETTCGEYRGGSALVLVPYTSAVREAWVPSCNCYMDEQTFNRNLANWNSRSGDIATWQDRYNQWTSYYRSYGSWATHAVISGEMTEALRAVATGSSVTPQDYFQPSEPPDVDLATSRPIARYTQFSFTYYDASGNQTSSPRAVRKIVARGVVGSQAATTVAMLGLPGLTSSASNPRRIPPPCAVNPSLCPPPPPARDPTGREYEQAVSPNPDRDRTIAVAYRDSSGNTVYGSVTYHRDGTVTVNMGYDAYAQAAAQANSGAPGFGHAYADAQSGQGYGFFNDPTHGNVSTDWDFPGSPGSDGGGGNTGGNTGGGNTGGGNTGGGNTGDNTSPRDGNEGGWSPL